MTPLDAQDAGEMGRWEAIGAIQGLRRTEPSRGLKDSQWEDTAGAKLMRMVCSDCCWGLLSRHEEVRPVVTQTIPGTGRELSWHAWDCHSDRTSGSPRSATRFCRQRQQALQVHLFVLKTDGVSTQICWARLGSPRWCCRLAVESEATATLDEAVHARSRIVLMKDAGRSASKASRKRNGPWWST